MFRVEKTPLLFHFGTRAYLFSPDEGSGYIFSTRNICCEFLASMVLFYKVIFNHTFNMPQTYLRNELKPRFLGVSVKCWYEVEPDRKPESDLVKFSLIENSCWIWPELFFFSVNLEIFMRTKFWKLSIKSVYLNAHIYLKLS